MGVPLQEKAKKNGFTQGCKEKAKKMGNVSLVTFSEMAEAFD